MVGSSKILTVSYGTFSCTLEGFDDSFGTMKAIAEYFRDLAADDRYFGAEPPVPDAQMLARIAEREVARRVEARLDGTGVTLRTGDALPEPLAAVLQAAPDMAPAAVPQTAADAVTAPPPRPTMRQVISQTEPAELAPSVIPVMPPVAVAPLPPVQPMMASSAQAFVPAPPRVAPVQTTRPVVRPAELPVAAEPAVPFVIPAHPDADSVAAKLQRIRAVVGRGAIAVSSQEFAEDLGEIVADPDDMTDLAPLMPLRQSLSESWSDLEWSPDTDLPAAVVQDLPDAAPDFDMASVTAALAQPEPQAVDAANPAAGSAPIRARVIRVRRADHDAVPTPDFSPDTTLPEAALAVETPDEANDETFELPELDDAPDLDAISDLMALDGVEVSADPLADIDALDGLTESAAMDFGDGTLPPDAEAELMEELAALERDSMRDDTSFGTDDTAPDSLNTEETSPFLLANVLAATAESADAATAQPDAEPATAKEELAGEDVPAGDTDVAPIRLGRDLLEREPEADAEAMERILSQTDAELNSPENSRRRQAISQLKAAVAATEAARLLGETTAESEPDDVESAFRDDLKQVVRPRRPVGDVSPDLRSERPRPAPLKLVASQRIDIPAPRPAPKSVMPVRPRRVAVQDDQDMEIKAVSRPKAGSFAEFAANMGATQLPDLLEAAAAYTSFVEGVEDFSRPQLMKKVQDMTEQDYSREDGLRSFGTLLRQGRIMKTANGRFVVNEESRFNPERKSA